MNWAGEMLLGLFGTTWWDRFLVPWRRRMPALFLKLSLCWTKSNWVSRRMKAALHPLVCVSWTPFLSDYAYVWNDQQLHTTGLLCLKLKGKKNLQPYNAIPLYAWFTRLRRGPCCHCYIKCFLCSLRFFLNLLRNLSWDWPHNRKIGRSRLPTPLFC